MTRISRDKATLVTSKNTGTINWTVPLGEYPELTARGIPPTGAENYGGPVATAGGGKSGRPAGGGIVAFALPD